MVIDISVPKEHHGMIIGHEGETLKRIQRETATKIVVPSAEDSSTTVKIVGTGEGVEEARRQIELLILEREKVS